MNKELFKKLFTAIINNKKPYIIISGSILLFFITIQLHRAHINNYYGDIITRLLLAILTGSIFSILYFICIQIITAKIQKLNINIDLLTISFLHIPLYVLILYPFHLKINGIGYFNIFLPLIIVIMFILISFFIIIIKSKNRFSIENIFLTISILFGCTIIFVTPPFQSPDEYAHFFRAYSIADLHIISKKVGNDLGDYMPTSIGATLSCLLKDIPFHKDKKISVSEIIPEFYRELHIENKSFHPFPNTALYAPVPYIPQALALFIGKNINLSPLALLYLGRIFNLLTWILLIYFSIKIIPIFKWTLLLISLLPISIFCAASLSGDPFINGISFLTFSFIIKNALDQNRIADQKKFYLILFILTFLLTLAKNVYFIFPILLYFLIDYKKFISKKSYIIYTSLLILFSISVLLSWSYLVKDIYIPQNGASPKEQLVLILSNPVYYAKVLLKTTQAKWMVYLDSLGALGWLDTPIKKIYLDMYLFIIMLFAIIDNNITYKINIKQKIIAFLIFLSIYIGILSAFYLIWTPYKEGIIQGPSGRYFIPIMSSFLLLFYNNKIKISLHFNNPKTKYIIIFILLTFFSIITIATLILRYYIV